MGKKIVSGKKIGGRRKHSRAPTSFHRLSQSAWVARKVSHVVKRGGHSEPFDEKKAYASTYFACRSTHMREQECEMISKMILQRLKQDLAKRRETSSGEIFRLIGRELEKINPEAAFMYKTHRDIS